MGTITPRRRADGSTGYTAQIRLKDQGKLVPSEVETFSSRALAKEWLSRREKALHAQKRDRLRTSMPTSTTDAAPGESPTS